MPLLDPQSGSVLLVVASPLEAGAITGVPAGVLSFAPWLPEPLRPKQPGFEIVLSGIGKSNAAAATAKVLEPPRHRAVLSVGIAGSLEPMDLGQVVIASSSVFADEGLQSPDGFKDCASMGFPLGAFSGSAVPVNEGMMRELETVLSTLFPRTGLIATVSTCSGTDSLAAQVRNRTGALAEAMEGASVGLVAHRLGVPFGEVRIISNTTGDRGSQRWDINVALSKLSEVIGLLAQHRRG